MNVWAKISIAIALITASGCATNEQKKTAQLEARVAVLEHEILVLKGEEARLRDTAVSLATSEISKREEVQARIYFRTVVLPTLKPLRAEFGPRSPPIPSEENIHTMADAYQPIIAMMTQLMTVAGGM